MDKPKTVKVVRFIAEKCNGCFECEKAGLNKWGGKYGKGDKPPSNDLRYWEKW